MYPRSNRPPDFRVSGPSPAPSHGHAVSTGCDEAWIWGALSSSKIYLCLCLARGPMATCILLSYSVVEVRVCRGRVGNQGLSAGVLRMRGGWGLPGWPLQRGSVKPTVPPPSPLTRLGRDRGRLGGSTGRATPPPARPRTPSFASPTGRKLTPTVSGHGHRVVVGLWARRTWCRGGARMGDATQEGPRRGLQAGDRGGARGVLV